MAIMIHAVHNQSSFVEMFLINVCTL